MVQSLLTALREGLEASLVVGIIVAYLIKIDRRDRLSAVWAGVGVAAALALGFAAILTFTSNELSDTAEEAFAGIMSVLALALVTSMVFWMRRNSQIGRAHV